MATPVGRLRESFPSGLGNKSLSCRWAQMIAPLVALYPRSTCVSCPVLIHSDLQVSSECSSRDKGSRNIGSHPDLSPTSGHLHPPLAPPGKTRHKLSCTRMRHPHSLSAQLPFLSMGGWEEPSFRSMELWE